MAKKVTTRISKSDETSITIRGQDLVNDLIGRRGFVEMLYFHATERWPDEGQLRLLEACLVTLMEHGFTPTAIVSRVIADSVPDEPQVAIAAGLLAVGSVFVGTMEGAGRILSEGVDHDDPAQYCREIVENHKSRRIPLPGFGHPIHKPDDPRSPRLFEVAEEAGVSGRHIALIKQLSQAADEHYGRHLTINATGAIAAILLDIGIPTGAMRAMAVVSRAAGLVGHLVEEKETRAGRYIWNLVDSSIPYEERE
jgi:citrate synthase